MSGMGQRCSGLGSKVSAADKCYKYFQVKLISATMDGSTYKSHWFPPEIISHAIWFYNRFTLSFRDVEDLLTERGITVSYDLIGNLILRAMSLCP